MSKGIDRTLVWKDSHNTEHNRYLIPPMSDFQMIHSAPASDKAYALRDFLDKFTLPQLVKVHEGYYDDNQSTTIGADGVCNLLTVESVQTVLYENAQGEETRIPLEYPCLVERVAEEKFQQRFKLQDLVHDSPAVKIVRVIEADPDYEALIDNGDKLKIAKKKCRENLVAFKKVSDKGKTLLKVPASCEATFVALWDGEEIPLAKFVKKNKLPVHVRFIDTSTNDLKGEQGERPRPSRRDSTTVLPEGVVKLKGILVDTLVMAATEVQGVTSKFSFPKTLPISVVPIAMKATSSNLNNDGGKDDKELLDDENQYEDMSGITSVLGSPQQTRGETGKRSSEFTNECMTIARLGGLGARQNTYSPAPSKKVLRSQSVTLPRKGNVLLQRTTSALQLETMFTDGKENLYDEVNFSAKSEEVKSNPSLMERRGSDPNTHRISKQNLHSLVHVQDQTSSDPESSQVSAEMVSLQIAKTSPTLMPRVKMKTFGKKEEVVENESASSDHDVYSIVFKGFANQQRNQLLPSLLPSSTTSSPFYGSEETETSNQNVLLASKLTRSSSDALPPLPSEQGGCSGETHLSGGDLPVGAKAESNGSRVAIGNKILSTDTTKAIPELTQRSVKDANIQTQPTGTVEPDVSTNTTEDPPPLPSRIKQSGKVLCRENAQKATDLSGDNNASFKGRKPIPIPRVKHHPFSKTPNEEKNLPPPNEKELQPGTGTKTLDKAWPGTEQGIKTPEEFQATVKETSKSNFVIPQDLSTLRVSEVLECLRGLNMQQFEKTFSEHQVDGNILVCLDEEALESFGMDRFHRLKLLKVIAGWRPQI